ncbi:MAG: TIR domain-containing protein [Syntrophobacterales bacterium]|nr:TIR domain-containing protein [Syntrophobacterales bacterium]
MGHDVFISYSTEDEETAKKICQTLESNGVKCWIACRNILPGLAYGEAIIDAIFMAKVLLVVLSNHSNNSRWVMCELERAASLNLSIIPYRLMELAPSNQIALFVTASQYFDAFKLPKDDIAQSLANSIQALLREYIQEKEQANSTDKSYPPSSTTGSPPLPQPEECPSAPQQGRKKWLCWQKNSIEPSPLRISIQQLNETNYRFKLFSNPYTSSSLDKTITLTDEELDILSKKMEWAISLEQRVQLQTCAELGNILYRTILPLALQEIIDRGAENLLLETEDTSLPWEFLHDQQDFLCRKRLVYRYPESYKWADSIFGENHCINNESGKVLIIANPNDDLPASESEAHMVKEQFEQHNIETDCLIGSLQCSYLNIQRLLRSNNYAIIHYTGKMVFLPERKTSAFVLANRQFLLAEEICLGLNGNPLFFLNVSHDSLEESMLSISWREGANNVRIMSQALIHGGSKGRSRAMLVSLWGKDVEKNAGFGVEFYQQLLSGLSVGKAFRKTSELDESDTFSGHRFGLFGDVDSFLSFANVPDIQKNKSAESDKSDRRGSVESIGDDSSWSDEAHLILLGAVGAMQEMNWSMLATVHLLLGMTYLPNGIMSHTFSGKGYNPNKTRRAIRKILKGKSSDNPYHGLKISDNLTEILVGAKKASQKCRDQEVGEKHLLAEILKRRKSSACLILSALKINLDELDKEVSGLLSTKRC